MNARLSRRIKGAARVLFTRANAAGEDIPKRPPMSEFERAGWEVHKRGLFVGCPLQYFEVTAKDLFLVALIEGMQRSSRVLEVGSGCLRTGYWFVQYLDRGHYYGIEPNVEMLDTGRELVLGPLGQEKAPHFDHNDVFDFAVFGTRFDFVIASSIWTHAAKPQIAAMLDSFVGSAAVGGKFITSWIPPRPGLPDYQGMSWVGRSHESDAPGLVAHSYEWLTDAASARGLKVRVFDQFTTLRQNWLIISRS